ncbi:MAG: multiprotein bridging factor aMBF1 [Candidatus Njordarchaeia archaeon]|nr:TIGR00270 family protein [Candidatus Korarchaeota archaeon]
MVQSREYYCEICGAPVKKPKYYEVEGAIMILCEKCSKYGTPVNMPKTNKRILKRSQFSKKRKIPELEWELVENYGLVIRKARERAGLKQEELAQMIGEPASYIRKLEKEKIRPSDRVIRKLERKLGIKLLKNIELEELSTPADLLKSKSKQDKITLGDIVYIRKKKKDHAK